MCVTYCCCAVPAQVSFRPLIGAINCSLRAAIEAARSMDGGRRRCVDDERQRCGAFQNEPARGGAARAGLRASLLCNGPRAAQPLHGTFNASASQSICSFVVVSVSVSVSVSVGLARPARPPGRRLSIEPVSGGCRNQIKSAAREEHTRGARKCAAQVIGAVRARRSLHGIT